LFSSDALLESLAHKGVEWKFIPKRAPWFGGFWEHLIGLTKSTLKKTLGRTYATLESLQTVIVEIEALLNDQPLTHVFPDIRDQEPITPSYLLYSKRITTLPHNVTDMDTPLDPDFGDSSDLHRRARAQAVVIRNFRTQWKREYLTALRETHLTTGNNEQRVRIGNIVWFIMTHQGSSGNLQSFRVSIRDQMGLLVLQISGQLMAKQIYQYLIYIHWK